MKTSLNMVLKPLLFMIKVVPAMHQVRLKGKEVLEVPDTSIGVEVFKDRVISKAKARVKPQLRVKDLVQVEDQVNSQAKVNSQVRANSQAKGKQ